MSDSIDRQKVLNTLDFADNALTDEERTVEKYKELLMECIKVLPSAEKEGKWIRTRTWEHDGELYCSVCGFAPHYEQDCDNFCTHCGAKMERGEHE